MRLRENVGRVPRGLVALSIAIAIAIPFSASASPAAMSPMTCTTPTVLVHDLASSQREWDGWLDEVGGQCAFAFTYGESAVSVQLQSVMQQVGLGQVAGLARIEDSAVEFGAFVDSVRQRTGAERVQVLAHGAGGLVAQHWIAHSGSQSVETLVTVGPLWNGTDIAGLGTLAAFNRSIGIYDELAALEKPLLDPACAACGQIVADSGYMFDAARGGWTTPGVRYVNVISLFDGLMTDPLSAAVPGSDNRILQSLDGSDRTNHLQLMQNPLVRQVVLDSLSAG
jgi:pimeloyl-ACP methyl ester carboxylesterase